MLREGDTARAVGAVLALYGAELYGFLLAVIGDRKRVDATYGAACARAPSELAAFAETCALRLVMYAVAHDELARQGELRRAEATVFLPSDESPAVRTISRRPVHQRTVIRALRVALSREDRVLLILRIDRSLEWKEIALVTLGLRAPRMNLVRESARLRARMRVVRDVLARSAEAHELPR